MSDDRDARRAGIARAVVALVEREGVAAATVRAVAVEAGIAAGSVRHFFPSQDALRVAAMQTVADTVRARLADGARDRVLLAGKGRDGALAAVGEVLEAMLPLDDERRREARVYAAFVAEAERDAGIAAIRDEAAMQLRAGVHHAVAALETLGHLGVGRDVEVEVDRLSALLDGLGAQLLAGDLDETRTRAVLDVHLEDLT